MAEFMQSKIIAIEPDGIIFGSPETLEKLFDDFAKIPKNKRVNVGRIKKRFLWWPRWTPDDEIYAWFDKTYPGGLQELMKKNMAKRFGEEYIKCWNTLREKINLADVSFLIGTPPELARAREYQAKRRGQQVSIPTADDTVCLTEEDKKRLLQEFAEE